MQKGLIRKGLVFSVIVLFIGVGITSSSGNIIINNKVTPRGVTISFLPSEPDGDNGWYINPVTVIFHADIGTIIDYIKVRIDGGSVQIFPGSPIEIYWAGNHSYEFCAVDTEENQFCFGPYQIKIDYFAPEIDITWEVTGNYIKGWIATITVTCYDDESGIERGEVYLNDVLQETFGPGLIFIMDFEFEWSSFNKNSVLRVNATDGAGNSATKLFYFSEIKSHINNQNSLQSLNLLFLKFLEPFPLLNLLLQRLRI